MYWQVDVGKPIFFSLEPSGACSDPECARSEMARMAAREENCTCAVPTGPGPQRGGFDPWSCRRSGIRMHIHACTQMPVNKVSTGWTRRGLQLLQTP